MQRLLALQWTTSEADAVVAVVRNGQMRVEQAWRIPLEAASATEPPLSPTQRLAAALKGYQLGRLPTVVVLGRHSVELRYLTLPAVPDEELPDLVRFQALRQFNSFDEQSPLDFVPLDAYAEGERHVLATTMAPAVLDEIRQLCDAAGLKLTRLVLRPCAAASLVVHRLGAQAAGAHLLVNLDHADADFAVILDRRVTFLRQVRLQGDVATTSALLWELRRTLAAAQNQPGGRSLDKGILLGAEAAQAAHLAQELSLPLEAVDPLEGIEVRPAAQGELTRSPGALAPLLGALWDEATATAPALDFLHPRQRPVPRGRRKTYLLAGLLAALLIVSFTVSSWLRASQLQEDVRRLQAESNALTEKAKKAEATTKVAEEIREWTAGNVNWLDELRWLSEHTLSSTEAMLTGLRLQATSQQHEMAVDGVAQDVKAISGLEHGMRDASHRLDLTSADKNTAKPPYTMRFRSSLLIGEEK